MYRSQRIPISGVELLAGAAASIGLGLLVSWVLLGKLYFAIPSLFFVLNWLRMRRTLQLGSESVNLGNLFRTRKIPYAWIAPRLSETQPLLKGVLLYYQNKLGKKASILIPIKRGHPNYQNPVWGNLQLVFYKRLNFLCGVKPLKNPERRARASSPEITPKDLLDLAREFPNETLENPTLSLFSLEDPELYAEITFEATRGQIEEWFLFASEPQQRLFLCDSIERLVALGVELPEEWRPLLEANRQFSLGMLSAQKLERLQNRAPRNGVHVVYELTPLLEATRSQGPQLHASHMLPRILTSVIEQLYPQPEKALRALLNSFGKQHQEFYGAFFAWQRERIKESPTAAPSDRR